jgi:undecaprenyl phosphate N,N'-diacetylbacillosamine 1-phosphate transferase
MKQIVKKYNRHFFLLIAGAAAGIIVNRETKRRRTQAKAEKRHVPYGPYEAVLKRPFDIALSGAALILLTPVMGAIALAVKIKLGSPVIFCQTRPGLNEKVFKIMKFRTMTEERDGGGGLLPDEERLTDFGKMLRSTSLDELPELVNILKGDMSIVGPRPLLVEYLERYDDRQKHRHDVKPGLTGLAQTSGRNGLTWEEKFEDDIRYADHITFLGDIKIILDTVKVVLKREGIHSGACATMEVFTGK